MNDASLKEVIAVAGYIPVEFEGAVFCLRLFPREDGWSDWVIYFRLSGGDNPTADDAGAFLRGTEGLKGSPQLVEFALCFPVQGELRLRESSASMRKASQLKR